MDSGRDLMLSLSSKSEVNWIINRLNMSRIVRKPEFLHK